MSSNNEQKQPLRSVVGDFIHNTVFAFVIGPFINGMSSAINRRGFMNGVKEIVTSTRGWMCNAQLALAVGIVATAVNVLTGRSAKQESKAETAPATAPAALPSDVNTQTNHTAREEIRREQPSVEGALTR